jgi:chemotaxis protein CheX
LYEFSDGTAKAVAGKMMGAPVAQLDEMAISAIGELANIITGNATIQLASVGYSCDISPPVILQPKGLEIKATSGMQIAVRFDSALGPVGIRVGLSEAEVPAAVAG